jgi:hypothetical protein
MENDGQPTRGNEGRATHTLKFSDEALQFSGPISKLGGFVDVWIVHFVNAEPGLMAVADERQKRQMNRRRHDAKYPKALLRKSSLGAGGCIESVPRWLRMRARHVHLGEENSPI